MKRTPLKRVPMKKHARSAAETKRIYGCPERQAWMREQPCIICGFSSVELAHVKTGGTGRKADARWVVPLCHIDHENLHQFGQKTVEAKFNIDLALWAQILDARWETHYAITHKETPVGQGK